MRRLSGQWILLLFILLALLPSSYALLNCTLSSYCPASPNTFRYELSGGTNAHLDDSGSHDQFLCCQSSGNVITTNACTRSQSAVFLRLFDFSNSHAELPSQSNYGNPLCFDSNSTHFRCSERQGPCGTGETCVFSLPSATNAHVSSCSEEAGFSRNWTKTGYEYTAITSNEQAASGDANRFAFVHHDTAYDEVGIIFTNRTEEGDYTVTIDPDGVNIGVKYVFDGAGSNLEGHLYVVNGSGPNFESHVVTFDTDGSPLAYGKLGSQRITDVYSIGTEYAVLTDSTTSYFMSFAAPASGSTTPLFPSLTQPRIASDKNGGTEGSFITLTRDTNNDGNYDGMLLHYHGTTHQWNISFDLGGVEKFFGTAYDDNQDRLYAFGSQENDGKGLVARFDSSSGSQVWFEQFSHPFANVRFLAGTVDSKGNLYVVGNKSQGGGVLVYYNSNGTMEWYKDLGFEYDGMVPSVALSRKKLLLGSVSIPFISRQIVGYDGYNICCTDDDLDADGWSAYSQVGGNNDCDDTDSWNNPVGINYTCSQCTSNSLVRTHNSRAGYSNEYSTSCQFNESVLMDSVVNSSVVWASNITNVSTIDSQIRDSTILDANLSSSVVTDSFITCPYFVIQGTIIDNVLTAGKITYQNTVYTAPFSIADICDQALPVVGNFSTNKDYVSNGSRLVLTFQTEDVFGLNVTFDTNQLGGSGTVTLFDNGMYPDASADDGVYTTIAWVNRTDNGNFTMNLSVVDQSTGNTFAFGKEITMDNVAPNVTLVINGGDTVTPQQTVTLAVTATDDTELAGCRYSNYNLSAVSLYCSFDNGLDCDGSLRGFSAGNVSFGDGLYSDALQLYGGVAGNATIETQPSLSEGSLSMWVKPEWSGSDSENYVLFSNAQSTSALGASTNGFTLYKNGSNSIVFLVSGATSQLALTSSATTWTPNEWHHVVAVWDATASPASIYLYVDGVLADFSTTFTDFPTVAGSQVYLGSQGESYQFNGSIDDVSLWSYAKSSAEVSADYNSPGSFLLSACTSPFAWTLPASSGPHTVYVETVDVAGNRRITTDSITANLGDITPPRDLEIYDEGDYTNKNTSLTASWSAYDPETEVYYEYRIYDTTSAAYVTDWNPAPLEATATTVTHTGLNLVHGRNYSFFVRAYNEANVSTTGQSDGIIVDIVPPFNVTITSLTHANSTWTGHGNINISLNGSDNNSGIGGYSFLLDQAITPDTVLDTLASNFSAWNASLSGSGVKDIAITSTGQVYASLEGAVRHYTPDGALRGSSTPGGNLFSNGQGWLRAHNDSIGRIVLTEFSENDAAQWSVTHNPSSSQTTTQDIFALDQSHYVLGTYAPFTTTQYPYVLDVEAEQVDAFTPLTLNQTTLYGGAVDDQGFMYFVGVDGASRGIIVKYSSTYGQVWNMTFSTASQFYAVEVDSADNVLVAGYTTGTDQDGILLKLSTDASVLLNSTFDNGNDERYTDLVVDNNDNVYVVADTDGSDTAMVRKYSNVGTIEFSHEDDSCDTTGLCKIAVDGAGNTISLVASGLTTALRGVDYLGGQSKNASEAFISYTDIPTGQYTFHARAIDYARNWGESITYALWIDRTPPTTPAFGSGTETYPDSVNAYVEWAEASDAQSGISGYHIRYDDDSTFSSVDGEVVTGNVTSYTVTFPSTGTWYVQVRAENGAQLNGSWSGTTTQVSDNTAPTITVISPDSGGTDIISTSLPRAIIETDENATCYYVIDSSLNTSLDFTGSTYHESVPPFPLSNGAHTYRYYCHDSAGNLRISPVISFTVSTTVTIDTVTLNVAPTYYAGTFGNATLIVQSGGNFVKGLTSDDVIYTLDTLGREVSLVEKASFYDVGFTVPNVEGRYPIGISANGFAGTASQQNLEVIETKLFVRMDSTGTTMDQLVYQTQGNATIGVASDGEDDYLNTSTTTLGSSVLDNSFIFVTDNANNLEKKEELLRNQIFLDESLPSFGKPEQDILFEIGTALRYDDIYVEGQIPRLLNGNYRVVILNAGKITRGPHAGKDRIRVYLEEDE